MRFRKLVLGLSVAVLGSACGSVAVVETAGSERGDELDSAFEFLSERDLSVMVLPLDSYRGRAASFEVSSDSGPETSKDLADDPYSAFDSSQALIDAGFVAAYDLSYEILGASLDDFFGVGSEVLLFEDTVGASSYLSRSIDVIIESEGGEPEQGLAVVNVVEFSVTRVSEDATGQTIRLGFEGGEFNATSLSFTVGRLYASVWMVNFDDVEVVPDIETIGREFAARITDVLLGDLDEAPVRIPDSDDEAAVTEALSAESLALTLKDLVEGVVIESEGFAETDDLSQQYVRVFYFGLIEDAPIQDAFLVTTVWIYPNDIRADDEIRLLRDEAGDGALRELVSEGLRKKIGLDTLLTDFELSELAGLGDDAAVLHYSFESPDLGSFDGLWLSFNVGAMSSLLVLETRADALEFDSILELAELQAERMVAAQ